MLFSIYWLFYYYPIKIFTEPKKTDRLDADLLFRTFSTENSSRAVS